jgi:ABC-type nitrate/sulfonate/bicarbonate transport system substrate-binding protein
MSPRFRKALPLTLAVGVVLLATIASHYRSPAAAPAALETVTIALPRQASTAPMFVAIEKGFSKIRDWM